MRNRHAGSRGSALFVATMILAAAGAASPLYASATEVLRNEKVLVTREKLAPGERETVAGAHASVVVVLTGDSMVMTPAGGPAKRAEVQRGDTMNAPMGAATLINTGRLTLQLVRVEFLTAGHNETWSAAGLAPNYKLLFEDQHSRTYDIRIAAHAWEPLHTHHDRVVICLTGARLEHVLPDGSRQPSTLTSGEVVWRPGQTHKGHNLGNTNLWVIAVEPK